MRKKTKHNELVSEAQAVRTLAERKLSMKRKREQKSQQEAVSEFNKQLENSLTDTWTKLSTWTNVSQVGIFSVTLWYVPDWFSSLFLPASPNTALVP